MVLIGIIFLTSLVWYLSSIILRSQYTNERFINEELPGKWFAKVEEPNMFYRVQGDDRAKFYMDFLSDKTFELNLMEYANTKDNVGLVKSFKGKWTALSDGRVKIEINNDTLFGYFDHSNFVMRGANNKEYLYRLNKPFDAHAQSLFEMIFRIQKYNPSFYAP